ncbi:MAG: glutathionylspermidine synthase family protein [Prosthecobacter sp.]
MRRLLQNPRHDWQAQVEALGLTFHTIDDELYWDESACYRFSSFEIDRLEKTTAELQHLCIVAAEQAIRDDWRQRLAIPEPAWREVIASWERDDLSLYGRFDLMWDGSGEPKLLEYNADTPTGLLEAAVIQWQWLQQTHPQHDQFNSIHEQLLAAWSAWPAEIIHFCAQRDSEEDWRTLLYLIDTCRQAGKATLDFAVEDLGWHAGHQELVDHEDRVIGLLFKLYPWEWMWQEDFARHLPGRCQRLIEPAWKMLWSNKAFLVLLSEMFDGHPNLLRASFAPEGMRSHVEKPFFSREGTNVRLVQDGRLLESTDGPWDSQPRIYQELHPEVSFNGQHPVIGSWIIGGHPAGIGIREDTSRITSNGSRFVPHYF